MMHDGLRLAERVLREQERHYPADSVAQAIHDLDGTREALAEAEETLERVREAATEVTNQESNRDRTHYESCWRHHLHCLAAKIIHETGAEK